MTVATDVLNVLGNKGEHWGKGAFVKRKRTKIFFHKTTYCIVGALGVAIKERPHVGFMARVNSEHERQVELMTAACKAITGDNKVMLVNDAKETDFPLIKSIIEKWHELDLASKAS